MNLSFHTLNRALAVTLSAYSLNVASACSGASIDPGAITTAVRSINEANERLRHSYRDSENLDDTHLAASTIFFAAHSLGVRGQGVGDLLYLFDGMKDKGDKVLVDSVLKSRATELRRYIERDKQLLVKSIGLVKLPGVATQAMAVNNAIKALGTALAPCK